MLLMIMTTATTTKPSRAVTWMVGGQASEERKLRLVTEKEVKGGTYCLNSFNGKLLAAVNSKIELFRLAVLALSLLSSCQTEAGSRLSGV